MTEREIKSLKKENADLKKRIEEWMEVYQAQGNIIEELKMKLRMREIKRRD